MALSDSLLFSLARVGYRTEIAHTEEMKQSLTSMDSYDAFRAAESVKMLEALDSNGISVAGKTVVDFGCNDGAMSAAYLERGAAAVIGVDIDEEAITSARRLHPDPRLTFLLGSVEGSGIERNIADVIVAFDVFEHVASPASILTDLHGALKPGGNLVIQTVGWFSPFAPHLWSVMPVPWAHVFFSEATLLRACRRVYAAPWYVPNMHDFEPGGGRKTDKYMGNSIDPAYLNKYRIADFERVFRETGFDFRTSVVPLRGSKLLAPFTRIPGIREFLGSTVWFVLTRR